MGRSPPLPHHPQRRRQRGTAGAQHAGRSSLINIKRDDALLHLLTGHYRRWSSKVIWMRSECSSGSIYWVLLVWGCFSVSKTIILDAQEHSLTHSTRCDTHLVGGLGLRVAVNHLRPSIPRPNTWIRLSACFSPTKSLLPPLGDRRMSWIRQSARMSRETLEERVERRGVKLKFVALSQAGVVA